MSFAISVADWMKQLPSGVVQSWITLVFSAEDYWHPVSVDNGCRGKCLAVGCLMDWVAKPHSRFFKCSSFTEIMVRLENCDPPIDFGDREVEVHFIFGYP